MTGAEEVGGIEGSDRTCRSRLEGRTAVFTVCIPFLSFHLYLIVSRRSGRIRIPPLSVHPSLVPDANSSLGSPNPRNLHVMFSLSSFFCMIAYRSYITSYCCSTVLLSDAETRLSRVRLNGFEETVSASCERVPVAVMGLASACLQSSLSKPSPSLRLHSGAQPASINIHDMLSIHRVVRVNIPRMCSPHALRPLPRGQASMSSW